MEGIAFVLPSYEQNQQIHYLFWKSRELAVSAEPDQRFFVELEANLVRDNWRLMAKTNGVHRIHLDKHTYLFHVPLQGEITEVELLAYDTEGHQESEILLIRFPGWKKNAPKKKYFPTTQEAPEIPEIEDRPTVLGILSSLGYSNVTYQQTGIQDYSMTTLTAKFSYQKTIFYSNWDIGVNFFMNVLPVTKSQSDITVRFLGANFRLGYAIPWIPAPWSFTVLGGIYYSQMFVTNNSFGYSPLYYPQIFPILKRVFSKGDSAYLYLKFVPLAEQGIFSTIERELAVGAGWAHPLQNKHPILIAVDFSDMKFMSHLTPTQTLTLRSNSLSLSLGYGW